MRHRFCSALALCSSLGLASPLHAQLGEAAQTTLPSPPDHSIMLPLTTQTTYTYTQTSADGKTTSLQEVNVMVNDSQARRFTANTVLKSGVTTYTADDPVAGTRFAWSSSSKFAKALKYPEPIPGRRSCWKLSHEEVFSPRGEPQLNLTGATCEPAEYPLQQPPFCKSQYLPASSTRDMPEVSITAPSCASIYPGQPFEDLGTKSIRGFEAQGCRTTGQAGSQVNEAWWIKLSSGTLDATLTLNGLVESPGSNNQDLKTIQDLTVLKVIEPDPAMFRPPQDYEIKTVEMHEVPCVDNMQPE